VISAVDSHSQAEEDASQALLHAQNCLLYENDPGPELLNVGTQLKPLRIPRSEAWQETYAMRMLIKCDGDHDRLTAARHASAAHQHAAHQDVSRRAWSRAVDLCDQALRVIEGAEGVNNDRARRILIAVCEYETKMISFGLLEGFAEDSTRDLAETLREVDATMADVPSPEKLVSWAFPWL
jgi:hypothetical protein